jgi:hypothetical protein
MTKEMTHQCPVCKRTQVGTNRAVEWCHCLGTKQPTRMTPISVTHAVDSAIKRTT